MNPREPPAKSFVLVVPEFPSDFGTLSIHKEGKTCLMDLKDGSIMKVYEGGNYTRLQYPSSESKWFIKINGKAKYLHLITALKFLKLYKFRKKKSNREFRWTILDRLREGLPCEDIWTLQGALIDALALKSLKQNSGLGSTTCAWCHRLLNHQPACCGTNYIDSKRNLSTIRRNIRKIAE